MAHAPLKLALALVTKVGTAPRATVLLVQNTRVRFAICKELVQEQLLMNPQRAVRANALHHSSEMHANLSGVLFPTFELGVDHSGLKLGRCTQTMNPFRQLSGMKSVTAMAAAITRLVAAPAKQATVESLVKGRRAPW